MKEKDRQKQSKTILFSTLLIAILMCFNLFYYYNQVTELKKSKIESGWSQIESVLKENQEKATLQDSSIKEDIVEDITTTYNENKVGLRYDMDNLDVNNNFLKILNNDINGKFLNVDNDNNDLFILSTWQEIVDIDLKGMVITDKSVNCMGNGKPRYFNTELLKHYNYELGYDALKRILGQNKNEVIFWEYLPSDNPNHIKLKVCSLEGMKQVYQKEGIEGIKNYEILIPMYINDNTDIFGTEKVDNLGSYNKDNRQIIVVQGFNLYDEMMKNHKTSMLLNDKQYDNLIIKTGLIGFFGFILTFVIMLSITKVQNLSAELEELGDDNTRQTKE